MPLEVGTKAPGFTLPAGPGEPVDLARYAEGRPVVVLFFPLAYSGVCTQELCGVRDLGAWGDVGAKVLAISVDSVFVVKRFRQDYELPFPVLSDFNRDVIPAWGVLNPDLMGSRDVAHRAAFVLDGAGVVRWAWMSEDADVLPPMEEIGGVVRGLG